MEWTECESERRYFGYLHVGFAVFVHRIRYKLQYKMQYKIQLFVNSLVV